MELQAEQWHRASVVKPLHLGLLHKNKGEIGGSHSAEEEEGPGIITHGYRGMTVL